MSTKKKSPKAFPVLYPNAAGIDISSREHFVAVNPQTHAQPVRVFSSFTEDLESLVKWLQECRVDTVAMEATGIYWVNLFLMLEQAGLEAVLVNARHVKNVRGKKTDMKDAEWIRQLHSCGLLPASFQPDGFTRTLRTYMRHRKNLVEMSATHIRMMQKGMEQMNIKLQNVIADITGKSGQAIIKAIVAGERNPDKLVQLIDGRIKASREQIKKSLQGIWKEEHLFELKQSLEAYDFYRSKIQECDTEIEKLLQQQISDKSIPSEPNPLKRSNKSNLGFDASGVLKQITGIDLAEIFGINDSSAVEILSEVGFNMDKWPTSKHFTSWLNLSPNNKITGGKVISRRIPKKKNRAGQVFRMAAFAVQRSKNWLSVFYHRIKARAGAAKAIVATARKIATIFYRMMKHHESFNPISVDTYTQSFKQQQIIRLSKQAKKLGFDLVPNIVT